MLGLLQVVLLGLLPYLGAAQNTSVTPAVCSPGVDQWTFNSLNQSPCTIVTRLAEACIGGSNFTVTALPPGLVYLGPTAQEATPCRCSSVYFSLLSACSLCQGGKIPRWSTYKANCPTVYIEVFPQPIPLDTKVPHYAYLDVTTQDVFNATLAQEAGGAESTNIPTPTNTGSNTPTNSSSNNSAASTGSTSKSHAGAIAGGVVGGLVGLAIIALVVFWILRRRRRPTPSSHIFDPNMMTSRPMTESSSVYPSTPAPRVYDPNDPSTYPSSMPTPYTGLATPSPDSFQQHAHITPSFTGVSGQMGYPQTARPTYTGAPEV